MKYRRAFTPGGTYFFTLVSYKRRPIFSSPEAVELLRSAFRRAMEFMPFTIVASVILPEHMHFIWTLPQESSDFSTRWGLIKSDFTRHWYPEGAVSERASRVRKGEKDVWQRRFWEHMIRDEEDLTRHVEYVHYNPVKHGLVKSAAEWEYSSFMMYVRDGLYAEDWGVDGKVWTGDEGDEVRRRNGRLWMAGGMLGGGRKGGRVLAKEWRFGLVGSQGKTRVDRPPPNLV